MGTGSRPGGDQKGCQIFVEALTRFAEQSRNPRLRPIIRRLAAPLHVAVAGRDGVGRPTVASALTAAGVPVRPDGAAADVDVVVIAEAPKPEDSALLDRRRPTLLVLNKADLIGSSPADAHRRAADCRALTGVPTVPLVGLLATADLDGELLDALRVLAVRPADLTSTDAFVDAEHQVPRQVRRRLLQTLDRYGIARAAAALSEGVDASALPALLRELSLLDCVLEQLDAVGAPVRYARLAYAVDELRTLAMQSGDSSLADFLAADEAVLAKMSAAVDVVEAAGVRVDPADDRGAHLRRAQHWRRYGRGPVSDVHRRCSADICRGSLRLLGRAR